VANHPNQWFQASVQYHRVKSGVSKSFVSSNSMKVEPPVGSPGESSDVGGLGPPPVPLDPNVDMGDEVDGESMAIVSGTV